MPSRLILPRKLWALLTRRERWQLAALFVVVVLTGMAQVVGVGSVAPFVSVLVDPGSVETNRWLRWAFETFGFESTNSFLVFLALGVLAAVILANSFIALTRAILIRFGWSLQYRISRKLLESYMAQPYANLLERNSADTGKNVLIEVERFIEGVALPVLHAVAFGVSGLLIVSALVWANVLFTVSVFTILSSGYAVAYLSVRQILGKTGELRHQANTGRFKVVNETFGGLKELKVMGRESGMLAQFDSPARQYSKSIGTSQITTMIPTYALQVLAVGVILMMAGVLVISSDGTIQDVAPMLAIFMFGIQRMVPFFMSVYHASSEIRFNSIVVDTIYADLSKLQKTICVPDLETRLPLVNELRLEGVSFTYPGSERLSVQDITITIPNNSFVAFVGTTGAGKTTLVDIILGLLQPDLGRLTVDGKVIDESALRSWQNNLGYVPQDIYLTDDTVAANITLGIAAGDRQQSAIEAAARVANIHAFIVEQLPKGYDTEIGERGIRLSGGERQRIGIARALYHDPAVLVLDEATSNLDQGTELAVHKAIEQAAAAKTVIMIAHRLSTTRNCDVLFMIERGNLVAQGNYDSLISSSKRFQEMAGVS